MEKSGQFRDDDTTQEVIVQAAGRPKRSALVLQVIKGPRVGELLSIEHSHIVLGRGAETDVRIEDASLSRMHARFDREGDTLCVTDLGSRNGTFVDGMRLQDRHRLRNGDLITLGSVVLRFAQHDSEELQLSRDLYEAAVRDRLTGLHNRGYFDDRLAAEYAYVKRHAESGLALLMCDLDHFKQVNDTHGHPAGDAVLKAAAQAIAETLRAEDLAARYGGEEFVVLARGADADGAMVLGERLRKRVAQLEIPAGQHSIRVTVSVGVAVLRKDLALRSLGELMTAADEALYAAKRNGRNQVVLASASARKVDPRVDGSYAVHHSERKESIRTRPLSRRKES